MTTKMPMMFSQNFGFTGKISRRPLPMVGVVSGPLIIPSPGSASAHAHASAPAAHAPASQQPQTRQRAVPLTSRAAPATAPRSIKQLFNMSNVMSNPGMPCRACGG
jgi:hypothetical protein